MGQRLFGRDEGRPYGRPSYRLVDARDELLDVRLGAGLSDHLVPEVRQHLPDI